MNYRRLFFNSFNGVEFRIEKYNNPISATLYLHPAATGRKRIRCLLVFRFTDIYYVLYPSAC